MALNPISLKELQLNKEFTHLFTITVKVLKLWTTTDQHKAPVGVDAIFVDNEGTVIAASGTKRMVKFLLSRLKEGATVRISKFDIEENGIPKFGKSRVNHPSKIMLIYGTQVVECRPDLSILTNGIKLVPFAEINGHDPAFYVDVIGQVVSRGEITTVEFNRGNARKIDIELRDDSNVTLKGVLWESYADKLVEAIPSQGVQDGGVIIMMQFAVRSEFNREVRVQTAVHATRLYINADLPEFEEFKIKKKDNGGASVTYISADPRSLKPEEWLNMESHRSPSQIKESNTVGTYIVYGSFLKVDEVSPWFYMSCSNCSGNVRKSNVGDVCNNAKCAGQVITKLVPKFRVKFVAKGVKEEKLTVVVFEEAVAHFIKKSCQDVYDEWKAENDPEMIPMDFCDMLYRDYLMRVRITDYNLKGDKFKEFSVDFLTDEPDILSQYAALSAGENTSAKLDGQQTAKGKEKNVEEQQENASNDSEGFVTPAKRASPADSDDDEIRNSLGTKMSSTKPPMKVIKKEKP